MPRRENQERLWWVVWPTYHNKLSGPPTTCSSLGAAEQAKEDSLANDEHAIYSDLAIRQMTMSEVAYEVLAAAA